MCPGVGGCVSGAFKERLRHGMRPLAASQRSKSSGMTLKTIDDNSKHLPAKLDTVT